MRNTALGSILAAGLVVGFACNVLAAPPADDKGFDVIGAAASRYAVLVGVNVYEKCSNLRYCQADVTALGDQLVKIGFDRRDIAMLTDDSKMKPSRRNILEQLDVTLKVADAGDLIVVALSGHGARIGGKSYFCPMDARPDDPEGSMIPIEDLYAQLEKCPARLKMVFIDACRNNYLPVEAKPLVEQQKSIDGFAKSLSDGDLPEGVVLLASCTSGERSWEDETFGHGVFMHYVLKGLAGNADRTASSGDQDGWVELFELCDYVRMETKKHVLRTRGETQRPYSHTGIDLPDFRLTRVPEITNSIGMKFKLIPAGEFMMGSPEDEQGRDGDEGLPRLVKIHKPFLMGVFETTQKEYQRVMGMNPSYFQGEQERLRYVGLDANQFPVERASWYDAVAFCGELSRQEGLPEYYSLSTVERENGSIIKAEVTVNGGKGYRLPTETEWEYACRAGTRSTFYFGNVCNGRQANCNGTQPYKTTEKGPHLKRATLVGSYEANGWGLFDMHGNVAEWCSDASDSSKHHRGGSWMYQPTFCRSTSRGEYDTGYRSNDLGFRVVREVPVEPR